jgi:hypothetical protein
MPTPAHTKGLLSLASLTFEQTFGMLVPPVHIPEPIDEPEPEPSFLWAASRKPTTKPTRSRPPNSKQ